jgi:predicted ATP-dependent protease
VQSAFESDEYRARLKEIEDEFSDRESEAFEVVRIHAKKLGIALMRTPAGLAMAPVGDDLEVIEPDAFEKLSAKRKQAFQDSVAIVQAELQEIAQRAPRWRRQYGRAVRELDRQVTEVLIDSIIDDIKKDFPRDKAVFGYLKAVRADIVDNAGALRPPREGEPPPGAPGANEDGRTILARYRINSLIDNADTKGSPVIYEDNPTFENLLGTVEHIADMGNLITDFSLIKGGSLHHANGGYIIIDAFELLRQPFAWEGLKRALRTGVINAEPLGKQLGFLNTVSLEPEPVPLDIKVVLTGERRYYYLLLAHDPEFEELFKVVADFDESVPRNAAGVRTFARAVGGIAKRESLLPFNPAGVARLVEHASREADDSTELAVRMSDIADLAREADHLARRSNKRAIGEPQVTEAVNARTSRNSRISERMAERLVDGTVLLDTSGGRAGQINALTVYQVGGHAFGHPVRVTARVRPGAGRVVDIEREVQLGGPLHSKGVLILSSYLAAHYSPDVAISLHASLVFEQSYGGIDGDSASSTELYALVSALADMPINQSLAVTGSVNQYGEIQAIGGANQKIEGYFDLCAGRGLTGDQGVLLPESNVRHLMLKPEVVAAVKAGEFHIYPIRTIDEGIEVLTGKPAGKRNSRTGKFPKGSVNALAEERLKAFAKKDDKKKEAAKKEEAAKPRRKSARKKSGS